jgi:PEP-CTERM motif
MKKTIVFGMVLAAGGLIASTADAGTIDANAVITAQADGADFDYTITLTNTSGAGNDSIATFWFAWVPGKDFMADTPISVTNPTGWKDVITHGGSTDGYAIQYDALTSASFLAPGGSLSFGFVSPDTPAQLAGNSKFFTSIPVLTSFVYSKGPLQGDGHEFVVNGASLPEPSSLILGVIGAFGSLVYWRRRRLATA